MDYQALTPEELQTLFTEVNAEVQRRNTNQRLLDNAWSLVMDAKAKGFTKAQVAQHLTRVVNEAYGG